jgi:uncharacterized damage-inducible protein DinB
MTDRTFAPWVEPIAAQLREGREQIIALAGAAPAEAWSKPSPNEGWTCKDLLAHLATGDWVCQTILRAVVGDEAADLDALGDLDAIGRGNARRLGERAARSVEELVGEVREEGEETQALLARLTEAHEPLRREGAPMSLGDYLRGFPNHDRQHSAQLRTALEI